MSAIPFVRRACTEIFSVVLVSVALTVTAQSQTYSVVGDINQHAFSNPNSQQIAQGRNGDVYVVSAANQWLFSATTSGTFAGIFQVGGPTGVTLGADGDLYTNFVYDGIGCGEVVKTTPSGTSGKLASICGVDGNGPESAPIQAPNGLFYGTSSEIFSGGNGTIYSLTSTGTLTLLHTFSGTDGKNPLAPLVVGSDGNLYGGTNIGGTNNDGVLFRITPGGTYTVLHNLAGTDGTSIQRGLVLARDGNLYGVTYGGGTGGGGVIFRLTNSGVYTVIYNILNPYTGGNNSLVQATDGKLYGTLGQGNSSQPGWIFSVTTTGTFNILHEFCQQTNCVDGVNPSSPLIQHTDGNLYGFTLQGGTGSQNDGVFYSLNIGAKPFATLVTTSGKVGSKIGILGQGYSASSVVKFNGVTATTVTRTGSTFLLATVPAGATDGFVTVTTGATTLTSSKTFIVHNSWRSGAPMPTARAGGAIGVIGTKIYVVSGETNSAIVNNNEIYNTATNTWTTGAPIPTPRYAGASAVVNGILYVMGGIVDATQTPVDVVEAYNPTTNSWSTKAPMPITDDSVNAVVQNGLIYVIGGYTAGARSAIVQRYNPATNTWASESPLLLAKSDSVLGVLGTTIVSAGGLPNTNNPSGDNEGYNAGTNTWSTLTADPTPRNGACGASVAGQLYVTGGSVSGVLGSATTVTESYNLTKNAWTTLLPAPLAVIGGLPAVSGNQMYCFGGTDNGALFQGNIYNNVQIYQP